MLIPKAFELSNENSGFQVTAESDDTIGIAMICDWLKNVVLEFQLTRSKT